VDELNPEIVSGLPETGIVKFVPSARCRTITLEPFVPSQYHVIELSVEV
jgi:hypothetical protein